MGIVSGGDTEKVEVSEQGDYLEFWELEVWPLVQQEISL